MEKLGPYVDGKGYVYFNKLTIDNKLKRKKSAYQHSDRISEPKVSDPDYLVLKQRKKIINTWIKELPENDIRILDLGGRLQPYRKLFNNHKILYVGIDPVFEGLIDIVGFGENLPFKNEQFTIVICTQVLNYTSDPFKVVSEARRVLKQEGYLYLSVPAIFPRYHNQRWRFMPDGLRLLLSKFSNIEIYPEGNSIAGFFRLVNLFIDTLFKIKYPYKYAKKAFFTLMNITGLCLDRFSSRNSQFATNYLCRAKK